MPPNICAHFCETVIGSQKYITGTLRLGSGGISNYTFVANFPTSVSVMNFENQSKFSKHMMACFLTHSVDINQT